MADKILQIRTEEISNPEVLEIVEEISSVLRSHAESLGYYINELNKKELKYAEWLSNCISKPPLTDAHRDPTYKTTEGIWHETKGVIRSKLQKVEENTRRNDANTILSEYYGRVVPKIEIIIKADDKEEYGENMSQLMREFSELQTILEKSFDVRSQDRKKLLGTLDTRLQETLNKRNRLSNTFSDNRKLMDDWGHTAISIYSRKLREMSEETGRKNRSLDKGQEEILYNDSFVGCGRKINTLLESLIEIKNKEKTQ